MRDSTELTRATVDQIVVSVGPYKFHNDEHRGSSSLAKSGGIASPPQRIFSPLQTWHPLSRSIRQVSAVDCITVVLLVSNSWHNAIPSRATSRLAMTNCAP